MSIDPIDPHTADIALNLTSTSIDRRRFLRTGGLAGLALAGAWALDACSSSSPNGSTPGTGQASAPGSGTGTAPGASISAISSTGTSKTGGSLKVGILGGSSKDSLDGDNPLSAVDHARVKSLYNQLAILDGDANMQMELAESIEPNSDNTEYVIRIKKGVTFHNGKDLTIDDVIFSLKRIVSNRFPDAPGLAAMDVDNVKKMDDLTAKFPMKFPSAVFLSAMAGNEAQIVPTDFDPKHPVGTGAFMLDSFTPGQQSVFKRNPNYFKSGKPYLDELVIFDYPDSTAASTRSSGDNSTSSTRSRSARSPRFRETPPTTSTTRRPDGA